MNNKYSKVIYESTPIGKDNIILELTTFDFDKYEKDQQLQKINKFEKIEINKNTDFGANYINANYEYIINRINKEFYYEHEKLMNIIEQQQQKIEELIRVTATPKLLLSKGKDLWED